MRSLSIRRHSQRYALGPVQRLGVHATGILLTFGIIFLIYATLIRPTVEKRSELIAEQQRLELILQSEDRIRESHHKVNSRVGAQAVKIQSLVSLVGQRNRIDKTVQILSQCATQANASVLSMQPTASKQGSLTTLQTAKISLCCDYQSLCQFLSLLHKSGEIIWVTELDVKCEVRTGKQSGYGVQRADMTIQIPHSILESILQQIPHSNAVATQPTEVKPNA